MCCNVITPKPMHKPMNNNGIWMKRGVIPKYNARQKSITMNNVVIPTNNRVIPMKNNVILDNTNDIHQQNDDIPPSIEVKQQDKAVIPKCNVCPKTSTVKNGVIPIEQSDIQVIPNDELSYTTGIPLSPKYHNHISINEALLCSPAVFMQHAIGRRSRFILLFD